MTHPCVVYYLPHEDPPAHALRKPCLLPGHGLLQDAEALLLIVEPAASEADAPLQDDGGAVLSGLPPSPSSPGPLLIELVGLALDLILLPILVDAVVVCLFPLALETTVRALL